MLGGIVQLQGLVRRWESEGIKLLHPSYPKPPRWGAWLGSRTTRDVIAYFSHSRRMEVMDDGYLRLWSLREMEEDEENSTRSEFGPIFADYLICCWCFRPRPVNDERSAVHGDYFDRRPPERVASSLAEFLASYERDPAAARAW